MSGQRRPGRDGHTLVARDGEGREERRQFVASPFDAARTAAAWRDRDGLRVAVTPTIPDHVRAAVARERR